MSILSFDTCKMSLNVVIGMPTTLSAAVPHSNSRDDDYKGYHIPKGSTMMLNVCTVVRDTLNAA